MWPNRLLTLVILMMATCGAVFGQSLAEDVVRAQDIGSVQFLNYEGPHRIIDSRQTIQGIGSELARQMVGSNATADYAGKYRVQRVHRRDNTGLGADLFFLESSAGVDHIRNLNWIVSAYLQGTFGYSADDADLLASFITRYNAWYRGNLDYVRATYIPEVAGFVTSDNVGLSVRWDEWAGKSVILIPLRDSLSKGISGSVQTEELSNPDVVQQMAREPDGGISDRKKLADLKEAEIVAEQKAITQAQTVTSPASPAQSSAIVSAGPDAGPTESESPTPSSTAPTAKATTAEPTSTPAAEPTGSPTEKPGLSVPEAKAQLAQRDNALQKERQAIVQHEQKTSDVSPTPQVPVAPASTVAVVRKSSATLGQLVLVDPKTNKIWKVSTMNSIRSPSVTSFATGYLVIAGDSRAANGLVTLVLFSPSDASVVLSGAVEVSPDAPLIVQGQQVFAVTKSAQNTWVLGSFDAQLKLKNSGTDALNPRTDIVVTPTGVLVQGVGGRLLMLSLTELKKLSDTEG